MPTSPCCPTCGYDLRATLSNKCPECGGTFHMVVHGELGPHPRLLLRLATFALTLGAIAFVADSAWHGSLMFWWSLDGALIVWLSTLLIVVTAFGPAAPMRAIRFFFSRRADSAASAEAAALFRFIGCTALGMGALGVTFGLFNYISHVHNGDVGYLASALGSVAICQLYALVLAIPSFIAAAMMSRRADQTQAAQTHLSRETAGATRTLAATAAAALLIASAVITLFASIFPQA